MVGKGDDGPRNTLCSAGGRLVSPAVSIDVPRSCSCVLKVPDPTRGGGGGCQQLESSGGSENIFRDANRLWHGERGERIG